MDFVRRVDSDDWRRQGQERYLRGKAMRLLDWPTVVTAEHDHCEFCCAKFSRRAADLHRGYTTDDHYYWVCEACFADFVEEMGWSTVG